MPTLQMQVSRSAPLLACGSGIRSTELPGLPILHFPTRTARAPHQLIVPYFHEEPRRVQWRRRQTADDIITTCPPSTMEDNLQVAMEQHIMTHNPELSGSLAVTTNGHQTALLIEAAAPNSSPLTTREQAILIEKIWPSIKEANSTNPPHEQIDKALILITTPDRPLIRDNNGQIQAAASAAQYTAELESLRLNADFGPQGDPDVVAPPLDIGQFVQESVSAVTSWPQEDGEHRAEGTFFERGMDSLVAMQLARVLRRGLRRGDVGLSTVYCNPTVEGLTAAIVGE